LPRVNDGILNVTPCAASSSDTKNPRSAKTSSPWDSLFIYPDFRVISLSETLPPHPYKYTSFSCSIIMNYSPLIYIDIYQDKICLTIYLHHYPNNSLLCHKDLVPRVNDGILNVTPCAASSSDTKNPRSAKTSSPWDSLYIYPDFRVISLCLLDDIVVIIAALTNILPSVVPS
jgi:hypothetical protein